MMTCTKETGKCPVCNGLLENGVLFWKTGRTKETHLCIPGVGCELGLVCHPCQIKFEKSPTCDGEIKKVWQNGKLVDCVCQRCGKSYGGSYLDGLKIHDSLIGANIRF